MLLRSKLRCLILLSSLLLATCGQQAFNSNSDDEERSNQAVTAPGGVVDENFSEALTILQDQCINCHTGFHNGWSSLSTSEAWVGAGLVVKGDPDGSTVINRLINYGSNMPQGGGPLSDQDIETLLNWINNL